MKNYELMLIFNTTLSQQEKESLVSRVKELISKYAEGKVTKEDNWGKRTLAYEIDKHQEGEYQVWQIEGKPAGIKELNTRLLREAGILRFLITSRS